MKVVFDLPFTDVTRSVPDVPTLRVETDDNQVTVRTRNGSFTLTKTELEDAVDILLASSASRTLVNSLSAYNQTDLLALFLKVLTSQPR